ACMAEETPAAGAHDGIRGVRVRGVRVGSRGARAAHSVARGNERVRGARARAASAPRGNDLNNWGVAKLVKAADFDSAIRGFESFLPSQHCGGRRRLSERRWETRE